MVSPGGLDRHRSQRIDIDDRLGEGLRGFLGHVVPDAAFDHPVRVLAREFVGVGAGVGVGGAVGAAPAGPVTAWGSACPGR
jgi:hypothetical protein